MSATINNPEAEIAMLKQQLSEAQAEADHYKEALEDIAIRLDKMKDLVKNPRPVEFILSKVRSALPPVVIDK